MAFGLWDGSHIALVKMPLKIRILYKIHLCLKVVVGFFNDETPKPENCILNYNAFSVPSSHLFPIWKTG